MQKWVFPASSKREAASSQDSRIKYVTYADHVKEVELAREKALAEVRNPGRVTILLEEARESALNEAIAAVSNLLAETTTNPSAQKRAVYLSSAVNAIRGLLGASGAKEKSDTSPPLLAEDEISSKDTALPTNTVGL